MITASCIGRLGRLGNQMFQVAAVIGYAQKHNTGYFINNWTYAKFFKNKVNNGNRKINKIYKEPNFTYSPIPAMANINIEGYFQSAKYFEGADIKKQFEPSEEIENYINEKYSELLEGETVSIHIRRGDYIGLGDYHYNLGMDYYSDSINLFNRNTTNFVVFSDDTNWCRANIQMDNTTIIDGEKQVVDLILMSKCKHNIIANSSFSWWASYLNKNPDKKVIAPSKDKWFGKLQNNSIEDLYLPNWILV